MNSKYADLPDIDTAPDVYETDDVFPTTEAAKADSSDDEAAQQRPSRNRNDAQAKEELDLSGLISHDEATKKFRKAERRNRLKTYYAYPPSPTSPHGDLPGSGSSRPVPLSHRLRALQAELSSLEHELSDPANPLLQKEREEENVDPGELIRGLVDVRGRLDRIRKRKEGRGKLVGVVMEKDTKVSDEEDEEDKKDEEGDPKDAEIDSKMRTLVEMDKRIGELEKAIGSSNTALDEASPLPPPLLPLVTRLNSQLALLTQPRHLDSISRRLKLLLSDLERVSATQQNRRQSTQQGAGLQTNPIPEHLIPILSRLGPSLPQIPHILTRLRTLSSLHTSAAEFQSTLEDLEKEHQRVHEALIELRDAVETVEESLEENKAVIKNNVTSLDSRVDSVIQRLDELGKDHP